MAVSSDPVAVAGRSAGFSHREGVTGGQYVATAAVTVSSWTQASLVFTFSLTSCLSLHGVHLATVALFLCLIDAWFSQT